MSKLVVSQADIFEASDSCIVRPEFEERQMALPLSPNTAKAVEKLFTDENKEEVIQLLTQQCAENLPNCKDEDEYDIEDLRFQVLKLSEGNIEKLREAVRIANEDWRDFNKVGSVRKYKRELLGDALESNLKSDSVLYGQRWNLLGAFAAFTSLFVLRLANVSDHWSVGVALSIAVIHAAGLLLFNRLFGALRGEGMATIFLGQITFVWVPAFLGFLLAIFVQVHFLTPYFNAFQASWVVNKKP